MDKRRFVGISRRHFLQTAGMAAGASVSLTAAGGASETAVQGFGESHAFDEATIAEAAGGHGRRTHERSRPDQALSQSNPGNRRARTAPELRHRNQS